MNNFIPTADAATLSQRCAASLRANGELMACMLQDLPKDKLDTIERLLAGGGSVGIETLVDHRAVNTVALVGIEREGSRQVFATVKTL
ncbi:hypothetical protein [Variovorax sp.]|uniref:hypothetical protein n=1 Tax=Variovorax sp. TaxID=1871043 RepID=UPI003BAC5C85